MGNEPLAKVTAYTEPEKLGPLGTRTSVLFNGVDLRTTIINELREAIERARRAAGEVRANPATAVHEYRKALRRARALLALIEDELPRDERKVIRDVLRSARRAVSAVRDQAVAPDALERLALTDELKPIGDEVLRAARDAAPANDEVARVLAEGAARAAAQIQAIEAALPPELGWSTIADGVAATYSEARSHMRKARRKWRRFHAWRRRTRELSYQLELIARHAGTRAGEIRDQYDALAHELGKVVDLIMVRELIVTHGASLDRDRVTALLEHVDDQIDDAVRDARRSGKALYDRGGRKFARKLGKASKKDLAQPAAPASGPALTAQA